MITKFNNPKLSIELVPQGCWGTNLRSLVTPKEWDVIRKKAYRLHMHLCAICSGQGPRWPVEAHEIWDYDDEEKVQYLEDVLALCPTCHEIKHWGRTTVTNFGKMDKHTEHMMKINGWTMSDCRVYLRKVFQEWEERSKYKWETNIDNYKDFM